MPRPTKVPDALLAVAESLERQLAERDARMLARIEALEAEFARRGIK